MLIVIFTVILSILSQKSIMLEKINIPKIDLMIKKRVLKQCSPTTYLL